MIVAPGKIAVASKTYDLAGLGTYLGSARRSYTDQGVVIRGDATLNYQDLADVLSVCDSAGIQNVRLPVRPRVQGPRGDAESRKD